MIKPCYWSRIEFLSSRGQESWHLSWLSNNLSGFFHFFFSFWWVSVFLFLSCKVFIFIIYSGNKIFVSYTYWKYFLPVYNLMFHFQNCFPKGKFFKWFQFINFLSSMINMFYVISNDPLSESQKMTILSSRNFIILTFTFRSMMHVEFIFLNGVR